MTTLAQDANKLTDAIRVRLLAAALSGLLESAELNQDDLEDETVKVIAFAHNVKNELNLPDFVVTSTSNLYSQLTPLKRRALAEVMGFADAQFNAGFRRTLENIPPLPADFTMGDVLRAFAFHLFQLAVNGNGASHEY